MSAACGRCGAPVTGDDRFCESCGFPLQQRRAGTAGARAAFADDAPCPDCGARPAAGAAPGFCARCGARRPDGSDHLEADLGVSVLVSDVGRVHSKNEDGVAAGAAGPGVAAVVCDGISSVSRPEEASTAAAEAALEELLRGLAEGVAGADNLVAAGAAAARAVAALDDRDEHDPPACTFVAGVVTAATPFPAVSVGWIGDSRAYWLAVAPADSRRLTEDDSWAGEIVRSGVMDYAQAMRLPQAHSITRWIGSDTAKDPDLVRPHVVNVAPDAPGALLLCSDGLWNYLPDAAALAERVWSAPDLMSAARGLNQYALDRGGDDNITLVLIDLRAPLAGGPAAEEFDDSPTTVIPLPRPAPDQEDLP